MVDFVRVLSVVELPIEERIVLVGFVPENFDSFSASCFIFRCLSYGPQLANLVLKSKSKVRHKEHDENHKMPLPLPLLQVESHG